MGLDDALVSLFALRPILLLMLGTSLGIIVGAIPGLTGAMLISLTLPLTFSMGYSNALILLVSMYVGSISGGLITATLLRMPGTPASMVTTLDGHALAKKGQPERALGLGITASFVGGMISWGFLVLLAKPMAKYSTLLGPFEMFSLVLLSMTMISAVSGESALKGAFSGLLGILVAMPGISTATGEVRLTMGIQELNDGFRLLPVLIGLFAVSQIFKEVSEGERQPDQAPSVIGSLWMKLNDWKRQAINMIRSSILGTWIGILPGIGANVGSLLAYSTAKNVSKTPEEFGQGSETGIVASESANNATIGGALIPLIALGIPGSVIDAILLGALTMHRLQPGPLLFKNRPEVAWIIMATMLVANVFMFVFMLLTAKTLAKMVRIPRSLLMPTILVFCVVGSYVLANRMFDVWVTLIFGVVGFVMERMKIPLAPFVIGFVLGPLAEENLLNGLMGSGGSWSPIVTRPMSLVFVLVAIGIAIWPIVRVRLSAKPVAVEA